MSGAVSPPPTYRCPLCAQLVTARVLEGGACPYCKAPARVRGLPVLLRDHLAGQPGKALCESLPALVFAPVETEKTVLAGRFAQLKSVTLYGNYGADVGQGVDARDLSAFADGAFAGHFSIALFDYFTEQETALSEAWRVLAPGGIFATLILDARVRGDASPPGVVKKIEKKPGYYDYWPDGVDLLSVAVGKDWLVRAIRDAGFDDARHVVIADPISNYVSHWFIGHKPEPGLIARTVAGVRARWKRRPLPAPSGGERIAAAANCTLCDKRLVPGESDDACPSCGAPARLRGLPPVWNRVARNGQRFAEPLLGFALTGAERDFLKPYFPDVVSVSLYGDYGAGHFSGVDVRDLSRFPAGGFSCVFSILLFDYFVEHEQALAEVARVLEPGGIFLTAFHGGRVSSGGAPPVAVKTIQSAPGYFDYVPEDKPLLSVHVGQDWFLAAMERAGLTAQCVIVEDALSAQQTPWFIGIKR